MHVSISSLKCHFLGSGIQLRSLALVLTVPGNACWTLDVNLWSLLKTLHVLIIERNSVLYVHRSNCKLVDLACSLTD